MATRPLNTGRVSTVAKFYLNKKVDVVTRIKSFAKRLRHRSILYNRTASFSDKDVKFSHKKLEDDSIGYVKVTTKILDDLVEKSTFFSNPDCIAIFSILSKIKLPLLRIESGQLEDTKEVVSAKSGESVPKNVKDSNSKIAKAIWRAQIVFLKLIMDLENRQMLTNKERYYFICSLSRECSIINFDAWTKLFKNMHEVLVTKRPDSLFGYEPHEIANIILVYAQISRWAKKRQTSGNDNYAQLERKESTDLKRVASDVSENVFKLNGYNNDPFNLDLISTGISKLLPNLDKMNSYKIIKLLYLLSSKGMYNNTFFQEAYIHLASSNILKCLRVSDLTTIFKIYSKACVSKLAGSIEMFHYAFSVPYPDILSSENVCSLNLEISTITDSKGTSLARTKNIVSKRDTRELDLTLEIAESLCLIVLNIAIEHLFKMTKESNSSTMKKFSVDGIAEMYDEDWKWINIVEMTTKRSLDFGSINSDKGANYTSNQLGSIIRNISHLIFLTKVLSQSLTICADKYSSSLKRFLFFNDKLNTLLTIIMLESSKGYNEDQPFLEDAAVRLLKDV